MEEITLSVPSPLGGGLGWGRPFSSEQDCPPPNLPPIGGGTRRSFFVLLLIIASTPAYASFKVDPDKTLPKSNFKEKSPISSHEPVTLTADRIDYDKENDIVFASGHVEIVQNETIVLADSVLYDQGKDEVQAMGNVSMLEPSGNVYFADNALFDRGLKTGVIHEFKARMLDDSVAVAASGHKISDSITDLFNVAYTPCKCMDANGKPKNPFWAIKADKVRIDQDTHEMVYDNAIMEVGGEVPVAYTPYFSHSTPGAENESGLLTPSLLRSRNLGFEYWQPVYYAIAPDRDLTLTPVYTTKAGPVLAGDYRQKYDSGQLSVKGSITNAPNVDALGNPSYGHELRGNYDAVGSFAFNDHADWGFNVARATDDTYLRLYHLSNDVLLTSRAYAEDFNVVGDNHRSYASIEGLAFQGLTGQDNSRVIPIVAPLMNFTWQSDPELYNSRLGFDANSMMLYRDTGDQSRRLSGTAKWGVPYVSDEGQVLQFDTQMRTDIYDVTDVQLASGRTFNGVTGRAVPQASATWHYPFINQFESASLMVEPVVNVTVSPNGGNPDKIPNEDSILPDFTDANLFSSDRFAGYDRVENGPRTSYGMRAQAQMDGNVVDGVLGQQYRVNNDPNFPITNDLNSHLSDYVGKIGITSQPYSLGYRFRLDKDNLFANRTEIDAGYNQYPVNLSASYLSLKKDPVLSSREVVTGSVSLNLDENWSVVTSGSRDLRLDQTVTSSGGITYKNECATITTMLGKDYTSLLDIKPSLTFWVKVSLKNLE